MDKSEFESRCRLMLSKRVESLKTCKMHEIVRQDVLLALSF